MIQATWGGQRIDREVIRALAASGNVCWGAFDGSELIGFVLGWAGVNEDGLHVHSHMLAALPDRRHRGVGYALKLAQRAQALERVANDFANARFVVHNEENRREIERRYPGRPTLSVPLPALETAGFPVFVLFLWITSAPHCTTVEASSKPVPALVEVKVALLLYVPQLAAVVLLIRPAGLFGRA